MVIFAVVFFVVPERILFPSAKTQSTPASFRNYAQSIPQIPPPIIKTSVFISSERVGNSGMRELSSHGDFVITSLRYFFDSMPKKKVQNTTERTC